ncbi:MAG: S1 RNA-binding domain-containing protein [Chitinispirillaceae bacterium]
MTEFSVNVSKKWNLQSSLATQVCEHFEKGDSIYYLVDYQPAISADLDTGTLSRIYAYLQSIADLNPKKKRLINALKKDNALDEHLENRIRLSTSSAELDDMLLPLRPNPRSRAQQAIAKGLSPLADIVQIQEEENTPLEELAQPYVGKDESLKSVQDVISGVKDILVERFAYDDTVRSMARDFGFEDGFFEVQPKNKKDKEYSKYRGKMLPVHELTPEELLKLFKAESDRTIRFKHNVQLFRITELIRHHFIENPDSIGFDLILEAIDECWTRYLQPMVEKDVKARIFADIENWAMNQISQELNKRIEEKRQTGTTFVLGSHGGDDMIIVAMDGDGRLLGAATEKKKGKDKAFFVKRLQQFSNRHKPATIVLHDSEMPEDIDQQVKKAVGSEDIEISRKKTPVGVNNLVQSTWMKEKFADLDESMQRIYAIGLLYIQPMDIIPQIGIEYFLIHPLQKYVTTERMADLVSRKTTEMTLHKGVAYVDAPESALLHLECVSEETLQEIRRAGATQELNTKIDLKKVKGVNDIVFRNVAGYIYFPNAKDALDRTLVHPDHYGFVYQLSEQLGKSIESLITDPDQIKAVQIDDFSQKIYVDRKLIDQLRAGQQFISAASARPRRRLRLTELEEGQILSGKVTNITQFGVFVDINATCDGLVHISQLAESYVENASQVVSLGEHVDVRVIKVDKKKKRISLSMKGLGERSPRVRPSQGQLSNLADHFKNR